MLRLSELARTRRYLIAVCLLAIAALVACGGGDETGAAAIGGTTEERLAKLEKDFVAYVTAQNQARTAGAAVAVNEEGETVVEYVGYRLAREAASENERLIVRLLAECSAKGYLHPGLPEPVMEREISEREAVIWDGLANGQYSSFSFLIGVAFQFCNLVEAN